MLPELTVPQNIAKYGIQLVKVQNVVETQAYDVSQILEDTSSTVQLSKFDYKVVHTEETNEQPKYQFINRSYPSVTLSLDAEPTQSMIERKITEYISKIKHYEYGHVTLLIDTLLPIHH